MISLLLPLWFACTQSEKSDDADEDGILIYDDCDDENASVGEAQIWYADVDGDGFGDVGSTQESCVPVLGHVLHDGDCDDENELINPDADEICDGLDNNCDSQVDVDAVDMLSWYADADGDGFGDEEVELHSCVMEDGYVADSSDCDDEDELVNPDADEICDGIDNNCDNDIDQDATDALSWFADTDEDGFGDAAQEVLSCVEVEGHVADNTDCDDTQIEIHPEADELCDGIDNNCDSVIDEDTATDAPMWYADADIDGEGAAADSVYACSQPTGYVANSDDCDDADATRFTGNTEVCDGVDNDCDNTVPADELDADGDNYVECVYAASTWMGSASIVGGEDCDTSTAAVNPGADELCSTTFDDNCDGQINESTASDATTYYADGDSDDFGDPNTTQNSCTQPTGYVLDNTDCDDSTSSINPNAEDIASNGIDEDCVGGDAQNVDADGDGFFDTEDCNDGDEDINPDAIEICDGIDNNCDNNIDEGLLTTYYLDGDGDTYGSSSLDACSAPTGYVTVSGDCNDGDNTIYPGALEVCDQLDNDCDGTIPADEIDGDGDNIATCGGDCNDGDVSVFPGASEVCDGQINDCNGTSLAVSETDDDGDGYVECAYSTASWKGSSSVVGGSDCDDAVDNVYPGAPEICDGIYNDCSNSSYSASGAPSDESDGDGDLYVECSSFVSAGATSIMGGGDCDGSDGTVYPGASELCDGQINDCNSSSLNTNESDADGDGYVACSIDSNGWDGSLSVDGGGDCDETSADADSTFPGAAELESTVDCMTDFDDDGYGDDNPGVSATAGTDCDDDDDTIYPGASEVQGDGIDQDCNGADEEIVVEWADVETILSSCMGCHGNSGGLTITYDNIVNGGPSSTPAVDAQTGLGYIEPGDPDASYLWHKVNGTQSSVGGSGGKMGNLSSSQLSTVEDWIIGGAQP